MVVFQTDVKTEMKETDTTAVPQGQKCSNFLSSARNGSKAHTSQKYRMLDNNGNEIDVWCYLNHNLQKAWTLVMSFSYQHYNDTGINGAPLTKNWPISEAFPNLHRYRMSNTRMEYIRNHTTSWSTVCNFNGTITDQRDTARGKFSDVDPMRFYSRANGECIRVSYINILDKTCNNCTSSWVQTDGVIFHAYNGQNTTCQLQVKKDVGRKFGFYDKEKQNSNFSCTMGTNSTTSLWFGD